jgi:hypothetical protein
MNTLTEQKREFMAWFLPALMFEIECMSEDEWLAWLRAMDLGEGVCGKIWRS